MLEVASIGGSNDLWFGANRMTLVGDASAMIVRQNKHGPLVISDGKLDFAIASFSVAGKEVSQGGTFAGSFGIASFLPQENRGVKVLPFLSLDADIDLPIAAIDFLNFFLNSAADLTVGGSGRLTGHVAYDKGAFTPGADITIEAENLRVDLPPYSVSGTGTVRARVDPARARRTRRALRASRRSRRVHEPSNAALFTGADIGIDVERSTIILPELMVEKVPRSVDDKSAECVGAGHQRLPALPARRMERGARRRQRVARRRCVDVGRRARLRSHPPCRRCGGQAHRERLPVGLHARRQGKGHRRRDDGAGRRERHLRRTRRFPRPEQEGRCSKPWQTRFAVTTGEADFVLPEEQDAKTGVIGFWSLFQNKELKSMLSDVSGHVDGALNVSDLDWITYLFRKPFSLAIADAAEVMADLTVKAGRIVADSSLTMAPREFTIGILDYIIEGSGGFDLRVAKSRRQARPPPGRQPHRRLAPARGREGRGGRGRDDRRQRAGRGRVAQGGRRDEDRRDEHPDGDDLRHDRLQHLPAQERAVQDPRRHRQAQRQTGDGRKTAPPAS